MLQVGKRQRRILDDPAVPKLPGQCRGRVSSYLSCCWVCGAFGCPPSPPELSVHPWKDPKSRIPLKDPSEGRVGFVAITVTPRTKLGWDKVTAPSCTSLEGRGRVTRAPERATSRRGCALPSSGAHPCPLHGQPGCRTQIHRRSSAAILPSQQLPAHFGNGAPHLFLANVIKGLKPYNGTSGVQQSRDCWISQLLLLTEAVPLGYCTY